MLAIPLRKPRRAPRTLASTLLACAAVLAPAAVLAADVTPGTYMLEGGSYTITVRADGDGLVVVEPNKDSPYARFDDDEFHFYNPNTQTKYGIRYLDARTIEAFKPEVDGNVGSRLVLIGGAAETRWSRPATARATSSSRRSTARGSKPIRPMPRPGWRAPAWRCSAALPAKPTPTPMPGRWRRCCSR